MMLDFQSVRDLAKQMIESDAPRNELYAQFKAAYDMDWSLDHPASYVKPTISPDAHNAVRGTVNILTTTAPVIAIAHDAKDRRAADLADRTQKVLTALLQRASRVRDEAIEVEAVRTATRDAAIAFKLARTADLADAKGLSAEQKKRYREVADQTPFLVKVLEPSAVHARRSICGLERVVDVQKMTIADVQSEWGVRPTLFTGRDDSKEVEVVSYWDREVTCVWVDGQNEPLLDVTPHKMPFLPYVIRSAGESMLYGVVKSKAWDWQNIVLTMMATQVFALGNMTWLVKSNRADEFREWDFSAPGTKIPLGVDESVEPLMKDLISKDMSQLLSVCNQMVEDTTVSKYVFGAVPQSTMAFAALNLMVQGGRIPLAPIQKATALALADLCQLMCQWIKYAKKAVKLYVAGAEIVLSAADLDLDKLDIEVQLQPDLPQDRLQVANTVNMLRSGQLISAETGRDMLPGVNARDEEQKILREQFMALFGQLMMAQIQKEKTAELQPPASPAAQQQPPQLPPGMPPQLPPELAGAMSGQPQQPSPQDMLAASGLPPTLATGQPPEGQMLSAERGGGPPPGSV